MILFLIAGLFLQTWLWQIENLETCSIVCFKLILQGFLWIFLIYFQANGASKRKLTAFCCRLLLLKATGIKTCLQRRLEKSGNYPTHRPAMAGNWRFPMQKMFHCWIVQTMIVLWDHSKLSLAYRLSQYGIKSIAAIGGCSVRQGRCQVTPVTKDPSPLSLCRDKVYYFKTTLPAVMRTA